MNKYSTVSLKRLKSCHPDLIAIFTAVLQQYDHSILCGYRDEKEQNAAYDQGYSKLRYPASKHNTNPSMAVDAAPYIDKKLIMGRNAAELRQISYFAGYVMATADRLLADGKITHKLRWGGDWNGDRIENEEFVDSFHFELVTANA